MCGIATIFAGEGHLVESQGFDRVMSAISHRGPDDYGYAAIAAADGAVSTWRDQPPAAEDRHSILFGHRRLSILDLSEAGRQPFVSRDGRSVLCYNGEIFNYVELRCELEREGVVFSTRTDTEVVLAAYERWGDEAFNRFNGMWAFTLWDGTRRRFVACRDRFGIKPLYYAIVDGSWIFASEIKALLMHPGVGRDIDDEAVLEFLARGAIDHTGGTLFAGVHAVCPGEFLRFEQGRLTRDRYWHLVPDADVRRRPEAELVAEFAALLEDSIGIRTRSDVPVGTMLSGGLDSTSIAAFIDRYGKKSAVAAGDVGGLGTFYETFSACWPDSRNIDEEDQIRLICDRIGLRSEKLYPTPEMLADVLERVTYALDQPFETPICTVQYLLMEAARARGIKVVLNGHGSDELLAGYPEIFVPPYLAQLLLTGRLGSFRHEFKAFGSPRQWSVGRLGMECLRGLTPAGMRDEAFDRLRSRRERHQGIFGPHRITTARPADDSPEAKRLSMLSALQWTAFRRNLVPQWLRMEDRVSMAHSVESRVPFMDYRIVEFAFNLPDGLKLQSGYTKAVLRKAVKDVLPGTIATQKHKQRFATPYPAWFRGPWRPLIEQRLLGAAPEVGRFLDLPVFQGRLCAYLDGDDRALDTSVLWRILHTEIWLGLSA